MSRFAKAGLADQLSKNPCQNIISAEIDALGLVLRRHTQQFSSFQNLCLPILDTVRVSSHAIMHGSIFAHRKQSVCYLRIKFRENC